MLESFTAEIAYKCDLCGELFNSPDDAQDHNQKAHTEDNSGGEIRGQLEEE